MNWINPHQRRRCGLVISRLAMLALPVVLLVGCGEHDVNAPLATATRTPTPKPTPTATIPSSSASMACVKLAGCDQCFINQTGQCISTADCAQRLAADVAICINGVSSCNPTTLGDCLFLGCDGTDPTGECQ